jgi:hypothetical protein
MKSKKSVEMVKSIPVEIKEVREKGLEVADIS